MDAPALNNEAHTIKKRKKITLFVIELIVSAIIIIVMKACFDEFMKLAPEREFFLDDNSISYTYVENEKVPPWLLTIFCAIMLLIGPIIEWIATRFMRALMIACAYVLSAAPMFFMEEFLKIVVARLRPDFISRCQPDPLTLECTNPDTKLVREGRTSFPSGHCVFIFFSATCLSIYLCLLLTPFKNMKYGIPITGQDILSLRVLAILAPYMVAFYVAAERSTDHRHHKEDIAVGMTLGIGGGILFLYNAKNLFKIFEVGMFGKYDSLENLGLINNINYKSDEFDNNPDKSSKLSYSNSTEVKQEDIVP